MKTRRCSLLLLLALMCQGCATGRLADLKDCGRLSVGVGLGLQADLKMGSISHPSLGLGAATTRVGHDNRVDSAIWSECELAAPLTTWLSLSSDLPLLPALNESYIRSPPGMLTEPFYEEAGLWLPIPTETVNPWSFHDLTDIQAGATLGVVCARIGVNPLEILDFLLGCVGFDIAHDDDTLGPGINPGAGRWMEQDRQQAPRPVPSKAAADGGL